MTTDVLNLTKELIAIPSVSQRDNVTISEFLRQQLQDAGFEVPEVKDGRLLGRGSCDMKGPLAATMMAGAAVDASQLKSPLFIAVTADEEVGYGGAFQIARESKLLQAGWPQHVVVAEPTELEPVYAHKGGCRIYVTAQGRAAHTSTGQGVSANFLIAPFLADMAGLVEVFQNDERFMNHEFDPPTNGFNMVIDDGDCASNVTAAKTVCTLGLRRMPDDHIDEAVAMIRERAERYGLEMTSQEMGPFYTEQSAQIVQASLVATGLSKAKSVPFGTEATVYKDHAEAVVLGPGCIDQAHTVGEWIDIAQLENAVDVYGHLIHKLCM